MKEISEEEFNKDPKRWQTEAQDEPVVIVSKDGGKLYLLSDPVFQSLYRGSRKAMHVSELSPEEKKALMEAKMDPEYDYLNAELEE